MVGFEGIIVGLRLRLRAHYRRHAVEAELAATQNCVRLDLELERPRIRRRIEFA